MEKLIGKHSEKNAAGLKPVTFMLPSHIAELIEDTREQLEGEWEDWVASAADQCIQHDTFKVCLLEFEDLVIDGSFDFDDDADRRRFMLPLEQALARKAVAA